MEEALEQVKKWDEASAKAFLVGFLDEFPEIFGLEIDEHLRKREDFARRIRESAGHRSKNWFERIKHCVWSSFKNLLNKQR